MIVMPHSSQAQELERYTALRLVPERTQIEAGETVTLAVEQVIAPHWHTYWKNPGDSGAMPNFTWSVPDGFEVGEVQWPVPEKIPYGPLLNYGYSDRAVTLHDLQVPVDYDGAPFEVKVDVDILVCADVCIPEFESLSVVLNDGTSVDNGDFIAEAREAIPLSREWTSEYAEADGQFSLSVFLPDEFLSYGVVDAYFIPEEWGAIDNAAETHFFIDDETGILHFEQARGERDLSEIDALAYVLVMQTDQGLFTGAFVAEPRGEQEAVAMPVAGDDDESGAATPLLLVLLGAFAGGLILNLMPCVFPVLSIKALSLVKIADGHPEEARAHGLAYMAGVVLSFLAVAGVLMVLKFGGAQIGWGFQLQNPIVVSVLIYLLFAVALNLFGLFEVRSLAHHVGGKVADEGGLKGAFFTGVLATIVATPCTAPFMATAIGVALTQSTAVGLLIFAVIGLGLAFPYVLLSFVPALQRFLPKPGAWMQTFQQFLAFPMLLAVVWLLWVLAQQVGEMQLFAVMLGLIALAFGIWLSQRKAAVAGILSTLSFVFVVWSLFFVVPHGVPQAVQAGEHQFGAVFSEEKLEEYLATDRPVFVEMTAAWCITCKVNHAAAINVDATKALFAEQDVAYLVGDWTRYDEEITHYLERFGRNGVPLYVFYGAPVDGARPEPVLLPQILTPAIVEKYVGDAN